jgi:hypothetical protein
MIARIICWFRGHRWIYTYTPRPHGWYCKQWCGRCMEVESATIQKKVREP